MTETSAERWLGHAIRARREALRLSQQRLADRAGTGQSYICHIQNGTRCPGYDLLTRIAAGLQWSTSQLVAAAEVAEHAARPATTEKRSA